MTTRNVKLVSGEPLSVGLQATGSITIADNGLLAEDWVEVGTFGHLVPGSHFVVGADATETAANLRTAIAYYAGAAVAATSSLAVVSLTARLPGTAGNGIILGAYSAKYTLSGANLTGGTDVAGTAFVLDTDVEQALDGAKLLSLKNATVEKFSVDKDGNIDAAGGISAIGGGQRVRMADASLPAAVAAANSLRTILLAHAADATEHTGGADTVSFASMPAAATDLSSLLALVAYQLTSYTDHDEDAKAATPTYHEAQYAGSDLVSETAPTTLAEAMVDLGDLKTKYNAHDADATAHATGGLHQEAQTLYEYATVPSDYIVGVSDTAEAMSVVLSTADAEAGRVIVVKDTSGAANTNNITVSTEGSETVDGGASVPIDTDYGCVTLVCDGTNWHTVSRT